MTDSAARTFANHRGVVPMLWVFMALAGLELVGVHLLLSLWSHRGALIASALTAISLVALGCWIASWKRCPHELRGDCLRLRMGSLRQVDVPLSSIARISSEIPVEVLRVRDTRNLVPIAHPNRMIELNAPVAGRRGTRRYAIRVDDPVGFDGAMKQVLGSGEGHGASGASRGAYSATSLALSKRQGAPK